MTRFCKLRLHHCQLLAAFNSQGIQVRPCHLPTNGFSLYGNQPVAAFLNDFVTAYAVGKDFYRRISSFSDFVSISACTIMRCFCSTLHYSYQCMLFLKGWNEIPEGQMAGTSDAFQTPGVCLFLLSNLHIWKNILSIIHCNLTFCV